MLLAFVQTVNMMHPISIQLYQAKENGEKKHPWPHGHHLDRSRFPLLHKRLQVLRTYRVVIQPESSGCMATDTGWGK